MSSQNRSNIELNESFSETYPLKILVAEDNPLNQKLIQKILGKLGYLPDVVENGQKAFEAVQANQYDVVLMDLQMPEVDGIEATKLIIAEVEEKSQPAIIALTANTTESARESCFDAGMVDFTGKPIKIQKLAEILQKHYSPS
jgi:CheY-like chemotaxis protein